MNKKYISAEADERLASYLTALGYDVHTVRSTGSVEKALACHPDLFMCRLGADDDAEVIFASDDPEIIVGKGYPHEVPYNAACTGKFFIHNLKYTSPRLLVRAEEAGMEFIDVKQGYAKCSTVVVDDFSIITYDDGIARACEARGMNILSVKPGFVVLKGYKTGLIGGASGRVGNSIIFNGDLNAHPDAYIIMDFINECGLNVVDFPEWPLTDIGSII